MGGGIATPDEEFALPEDSSSHESYVAEVQDTLLSDLDKTVEYFVDHPSDEV